MCVSQPYRRAGVYTWKSWASRRFGGIFPGRTHVSRFDTLPANWMVFDDSTPASRGEVLEYSRELEKFLADIERRAFRMAQIALRDPDDALDVVQDAMLKLTKN